MRPFGRYTIRRREVRRAGNGHVSRTAMRLLRRESLLPLVLLGLFLAALCLIILYGQVSLSYRVGQRVQQPIVARVDFTWNNPLKEAQEKDIGRRGVPNYYRLDGELIQKVDEDLKGLTKAVEASQSYNDFLERLGASGWKFDEPAWRQLKTLVIDQPQPWQQMTADFIRRLVIAPIIWSQKAAQREPKSLVAQPVVIGGPENVESDEARPEPRKLYYYYDLGDREQLNQASGWLVGSLPEGLDENVREGFRGYLGRLLLPRGASGDPNPVFKYDAEETRRRMDQAAQAVRGVESYSAGQILLSAPTVIGEASVLALLKAERDAYHRALRTDAQFHSQYLLWRLGLCGLALAAGVGLAVYTQQYRAAVVQGAGKALALMLLILATVALARWLAISDVSYPDRWSVLPVVLTGMVVAVSYEQRYAIGVVFATALLAALALQSPDVSPPIGRYILLVGAATVAVALLDDIRTRTKLLFVALATATAAAALSFAGDIALFQEVRYSAINAGVAAGAALIAGLLMQAVLPIIERVFGVVTSMTLLEWCDINKPLLRRLASEAPGTYNHALVLGSLAESAAESVGANGLLTRVGAYYHDIGKINKPRYFVENQQSTNWHDRLSPTMSLLIIIGHVKDGLEMAREYGLPRVLWPFIAQHHGTTLVRYFYRQAERQAGQQPVAETDFRYSGPKPRSKETAILMLADSVEGAVRALSEPTPGRIEGLVHQLLMDRLADGQFDESDITLRELHRIEESMVKSLCAIYHGRIAYPSAKDKEIQKEAARETARSKAAEAQSA